MRNILIYALTISLFSTTPAISVELKFNTQDFAPFSYMKNGLVSGPAVDIIRDICTDIKVNYSFKLLPWRRAQKEVENGDANAMFLIGWNKKRSKWLYFSPPVLDTEYGFFVLKNDNRNFKNIYDLKGYTVAVYGPSNTSNSLQIIKEKITDLSIDLRHDDECGFKKLSRKRVDAVYSNKDVGYSIMRKLSIKNIKYLGPNKRLKYYIGFSKKYTDKKFVDIFNKAFLRLLKKGRIKQILKRYSMKPSKG